MTNNKEQTEMNKEFIPYLEALDLSELGFNEPCFGYYITIGEWFPASYPYSGTEYPKNSDMPDPTWATAPTYSQAFRWFREKHQLVHHISWVYKKTYDGVDWFFQIKGINMANNNVLPHEETRFGTYEEAELASLKKMIEIVKASQG
jgi:hypothetical protein